MTRQQDTLTARQAADDWNAERGLPPSRGYSGQWYQDAYLNGWWPAGWKKWWAVYNGQPGSIIGDDIVGHQWTSTPVDQNVFLESEIVQSGGTEDPVTEEGNPCAGLINGLAYVADSVVADTLNAELERRTASGAKAAIRRTLVQQVVAESQRVRTEQVGPRPDG